MSVAVVVPGAVYTHVGRLRHSAPASETIERAKLRGITDLCLDESLIPEYAAAARGGDFVSNDPRRGGFRARVNGVYLHSLSASSWLDSGVYDFPAVASSLSLVSASLGNIPLGYSPRWRGESLLKLTNNKHPEWFMGSTLPECPQDSAPNWVLPQRWDERRRVYLHSFDRSADYLGVARSTVLGVGDFKYTRTFSPKACGVWRVTASPTLRASVAPIRETGVYDTASVRAALERGSDIQILGGWVFEGQYTVLRAWAERLTKARRNVLDNGDRLAQAAVKAVYVRTLGKLASPAHPPRLWNERAHWWYSIVAESSRRMYSAIAPHPEVMAVETDRVSVVSFHRSPQAAFKPYMANAGTNPGNWRYIGSLPFTRSVARETRAENARDFHKAIDDMGRWEDWRETAAVLPLASAE